MHNFEAKEPPLDPTLCANCGTVETNGWHTKYVNPFKGQTLRKVDQWSNMYEEYREEIIPGDIERAQIVCSDMWKPYGEDKVGYTPDGKYHFADKDAHKPILDIDFPAQLLPSTTEGHFHLFLDKEMSWEMYEKLLRVLAECGIIEQGYANASISRHYSAARLPWVKKEKHLNPNHPDKESPF